MIKFENDYSYINESEKKIIEFGLADYDIFGLRLYNSNKRELTKDQRNNILKTLSNEFKIYQYDESVQYINRETNMHEWDLFNSPNHINFNDHDKTIEDRKNDLNKIKEVLKNYNDDIIIVIQYETKFHKKELENIADSFYNSNKNKFINNNGIIGKIKIVEEYKDSYYGTICKYGFFKKGARRSFYSLTNMQIALLAVK